MAFKIAFCAGHYKYTAGKRVPKQLDPNETREWYINDRVAKHFARAALEYDGVEILRTDDSTGENFIDIPERCASANKWGADLYIDMHHNAGIMLGKGGGVCAFSYPKSEKGKAYRDAIYNAVIAAGGLKGNRAQPLQEKKFDSLSYSHMPAVLMEYGFMDSKTDAPIILTDEYSKLVAYATMAGIAKVAGLKKKGQPEAAAKKSVAEIAKEVIAGKWGNGADRKQKLTAAGYDYNEVQAAVNAQLTGRQPAADSDYDIDRIAREVIAGKWYSGAARKSALTKAGYDYNAVQKRVNKLLKG